MDAELRISDAERDRAATALGEHFVQGRLTPAEHTERLDRIWAARTRGDLEPVFRDLPDAARLPSERSTPPAYWSGRRRTPFPTLLLVLAALLVLTIVTHVPFVMIGLLAVLFVVLRRRSARWARRSR